MKLINREVQLALNVLQFLHSRPNERLGRSEIAKDLDESSAFILLVCGKLARAGFVDTVRGAKGGYQWVKGTEKRTLGELLESLEREPKPNPAWHDKVAAEVAGRAISEFLDKLKLRDLFSA